MTVFRRLTGSMEGTIISLIRKREGCGKGNPFVAIVMHSSLPEGAPKDEMDVLQQAGAVSLALSRMGYEILEIPFSQDGIPLDWDVCSFSSRRAASQPFCAPQARGWYEDKVIRAVTESAGVFYPEEIDIAEELARENLNRGAQESGYHLLVAESGGEVCGFTCIGLIPGARLRYDLYWIAVAETFKGDGVGSELMARSEAAILKSGGVKIYAETSSRPSYAPARAFYRRSGYQVDAVLKDYYDDGDDKVIFAKVLGANMTRSWDKGGD